MSISTERQISSGGIAYRRNSAGEVEIALICVGDKRRWQLPKGLVDPGEYPEATAVRETREEAGIETELVAPLDTIEYWYVAARPGGKVRYHKFVHFYLLRLATHSQFDVMEYMIPNEQILNWGQSFSRAVKVE